MCVSVLLMTRAGRRFWTTIVLSQERTELSRMIPSFGKKNGMKIRILKNIGRERRITERNWIDISLKERLKSGTRSYYQEHVLRQVHILNQECMLNNLEIINICFWFDHPTLNPPFLGLPLSWGRGALGVERNCFP